MAEQPSAQGGTSPPSLQAQILELQQYIRNQATQRNPPVTEWTQRPYEKETYKIHEQYDHSQPSLWPQFELKLRAKLQIDGHLLGDDQRKIYGLFSYLSGVAAQRALPWVENYATNSTVNKFLDYLRTIFGDPTRTPGAPRRPSIVS